MSCILTLAICLGCWSLCPDKYGRKRRGDRQTETRTQKARRQTQDDMKDGSMPSLNLSSTGLRRLFSGLALKLAHPLVPPMGVRGTDYVTVNYQSNVSFSLPTSLVALRLVAFTAIASILRQPPLRLKNPLLSTKYLLFELPDFRLELIV